MTFPENLTISVESTSRSRSLLLQHLRLGRSSPSLELPAEMQLLPEQLGSSKLESRLRGTRLGHRAEQSSARAVCGREGTLEEGTQGSSPPFPSFLHSSCASGTYAIAFGEISDEHVFHSQCNLAAIDKGKSHYQETAGMQKQLHGHVTM